MKFEKKHSPAKSENILARIVWTAIHCLASVRNKNSIKHTKYTFDRVVQAISSLIRLQHLI